MKQNQVIISLVIVCFSIYLFMTGFHNADSCITKYIMTLEQEASYYELKIDGSSWSLTDCYLMGLSQQIRAFFLVLISAFFLGEGLFSNARRKAKNLNRSNNNNNDIRKTNEKNNNSIKKKKTSKKNE